MKSGEEQRGEKEKEREERRSVLSGNKKEKEKEREKKEKEIGKEENDVIKGHWCELERKMPKI